MKVVSPEQMSEIEGRAIDERGIPGELLMERAGRAVADGVCELAGLAGVARPSVLVVAGKGNNAGDAFVAARILAGRDARAGVWLAGETGKVRGDARTHLEKMLAAGVRMRQMPLEQDWSDAGALDERWDIVVDGLLGTGLRGIPEGAVAGAIALVNRLSKRSLVVAVDVPSGLDAGTGRPGGDQAVVADLTVTMGFPKRGLLTPTGIEYTGSLRVADIGIPADLADHIKNAMELIDAGEVSLLFKRRPRCSHKGSFGHVLIVGGSAGYGGAVAMAAKGALRSGAGLVTVFTPRSVAAGVAASVQEAMVHGVKETDSGALSSDFWLSAGKDPDDFDSILVGPGMGVHDECRRVVTDLLRRCRVPLVLDADALNVQKSGERLIPLASCPVTISPHPGELARFMAVDTAAIQADRLKAALDAAEVANATVVLKGSGTIVAERDKVPVVNMTGNPGMATGGSGDVLAGVIAGLLGQGLCPFDAARAAVYIHGRAGDRAAWRWSQAGLVAGDVIGEIPFVMKELCGR